MINNQIKKLRIEKGLSQEQLAEKANVSVRTIQRLEAGNDGSIATLNLIANALEVKVSDLFNAETSSQQQVKIQSADSQLQYQLHERRKEFKTYDQFYSACYVVLMIICALLLNMVDDNNNFSLLIGGIWVIALAIMRPLKKWLVINVIDPKLDRKYPLTINKIDKDKNPK